MSCFVSSYALHENVNKAEDVMIYDSGHVAISPPSSSIPSNISRALYMQSHSFSQKLALVLLPLCVLILLFHDYHFEAKKKAAEKNSNCRQIFRCQAVTPGQNKSRKILKISPANF
jgi:hypothetical protein